MIRTAASKFLKHHHQQQQKLQQHFSRCALLPATVRGYNNSARRTKSATRGSPPPSSTSRDATLKLHNHLEELVHATTPKPTQIQPPPHQSVYTFLSKNKAEMINIVATFACTILAYQIVGWRQTTKKLEQSLQDKCDELEQAQGLLSSLLERDTFARPVAEECQRHVANQTDATSSSSSSSWFQGSTSRSATTTDCTEAFVSIFHQALKRRIGTAGLSETEKKDDIMLKLQQAQEDLLKDVKNKSPAAAPSKHEREYQDEPELVEILETAAGSKVVRTRNFSI